MKEKVSYLCVCAANLRNTYSLQVSFDSVLVAFDSVLISSYCVDCLRV